MKSIIDIGMDDHKKIYSLCAVLKEFGEVLFETRTPADLILLSSLLRMQRVLSTSLIRISSQAMSEGALAIFYKGSLQNKELIVIFLLLLPCSAQLRIWV